MAFDLSNVTPEELAQLRALLEKPDQRSVSPKPLTNLNPPMTAKGRLFRPHFEWSADPPPEGIVIPPFPRLMWDAHGKEVRIESPEHLERLSKAGQLAGWTDRPPMANAVSEDDRLRGEIAMLSESDREFLLKSVKDARMANLKERMQGLSNEDIAMLLPKAEPAVKASKKEQAS